MKVVLIISVFAFMAVQLSLSAPAPDEEKKDVPATAVAADSPVAQPTSVQVKSAPSEAAAVSHSEASPPAEEKKA